ncbi:MAG: HAMP domain-containing sensor histidine kinase [bacterium]
MIARFQATVMRSTPLRLTGLLVILFVASILISLGIAYLLLKSSIDEDIQSQMVEEFASFRLIADQNDLEERIAQEAAAAAPQTMIITYQADGGQSIGNVAPMVVFPVTSIVKGALVQTPQAAASYLVQSSRIGQGTLTLGFSRQQVTELGEVFWLVFLISPLVTLGFAGAIGLWVARAARNRVEAIRSTLADLTAGHLEARVPISNNGPDDLNQISQSVNRMAAAQAAAVASLRQISSDIAHDLKTPIQRVAVLLERLENSGGLSDLHQDLVSAARRQTDQISRIFQSLLQIAQLEGGSNHDHFTQLDLHRLAASIVEVYETTAEDSGHDLRLICEGTGPFTIFGEPNLLGQVLANLIENALRHTQTGSRIEVVVKHVGPQSALIVHDNGPGIPAWERQNVLRRLYRLERSRTSEGSGLGLSMVAAICDLHGAKLLFDDAGPGLVVTVTFSNSLPS